MNRKKITELTVLARLERLVSKIERLGERLVENQGNIDDLNEMRRNLVTYEEIRKMVGESLGQKSSMRARRKKLEADRLRLSGGN